MSNVRELLSRKGSQVYTIGPAATVLEAAQIANYAGGIVVMKRGTATVTHAELLGAISAEATGGAGTGAVSVDAGSDSGKEPKARRARGI